MYNKMDLLELGILAQECDELAMLEIINRKKNLLKKFSYGDEDRHQFMTLKLIQAVKNYKF